MSTNPSKKCKSRKTHNYQAYTNIGGGNRYLGKIRAHDKAEAEHKVCKTYDLPPSQVIIVY